MKKRTINRRYIYRSIVDFEKEFLPDTYKARSISKEPDSYLLGIQMAKDVIQSIRTESNAVRHISTKVKQGATHELECSNAKIKH